jgi:hypothetical protein
VLSSEVDPDEARRAARDILSGAEYAEPQESLVERAVGWIFDRLGDAIATLTGGGPGSVIGWLVVMVLGAGAAWLVVRALQVPGVGRVTHEGRVRFGTESHRDAAIWLQEADRLSRSGDHRGALRCQYQALLARMIIGGAVDDVAGRTSGEYRRAVTELLPSQDGPISTVTGTFESVWYGGADVGAGDVERFAAECRRIEHELLSSSALAGSEA